MTLTGMNRYQAFAVHMAISLVIFFVLLVCITQYWYPGILFDTGNGWKAIALIVSIDLILGPLLTFIIFNPNKSSLKFDLSVIALVQIAALAYGTWTIYSSRPLAIAYINSSFHTFYANADNAKDIKEVVKQLKTRQLFYVFDEENPSQSLNSNQLAPYADHSKIVTNNTSPYHHKAVGSNNFWVQVDPLASANRYLLINKDSGAIVKFSKKPNLEDRLEDSNLEPIDLEPKK